jgi:hypothetical protein
MQQELAPLFGFRAAAAGGASRLFQRPDPHDFLKRRARSPSETDGDVIINDDGPKPVRIKMMFDCFQRRGVASLLEHSLSFSSDEGWAGIGRALSQTAPSRAISKTARFCEN